MTNKKRLPVSMYLRPCPDCCATYRDNQLLHELSCPLQAAVERVCEQDRRYFIEHPNEQEYTRPIARAECQQLAHTDPRAPACTHVIVHNCRRGRIRSFANGELVHGIMLDFGA